MEKRIVEINGVKLELDMREATRIETLAVGSRVKVLIKRYGDSFVVCPGIVVGFDPFRQLPTITIVYLQDNRLCFLAWNEKSEQEIVADIDQNPLTLDKTEVTAHYTREIEKKLREAEQLEKEFAYFKDNFGRYFTE